MNKPENNHQGKGFMQLINEVNDNAIARKPASERNLHFQSDQNANRFEKTENDEHDLERTA